QRRRSREQGPDRRGPRGRAHEPRRRPLGATLVRLAIGHCRSGRPQAQTRDLVLTMRRHLILKAIAPLFAAAQLLAQDTGSCPATPGGAFGITGYQCANCGVSRVKGQRASYSFMTEPVVVDAVPGGKIVAGDVIEAVNGKPITTRAG